MALGLSLRSASTAKATWSALVMPKTSHRSLKAFEELIGTFFVQIAFKPEANETTAIGRNISFLPDLLRRLELGRALLLASFVSSAFIDELACLSLMFEAFCSRGSRRRPAPAMYG